ncbi:3'-5' exoribonuclease YhaM family protein [Bacteroidota bacterium]
MLEQTQLSKLEIGDRLNHFVIVSKFEIKTTKTNKPYLNLELRDKSATLPAKVWDNFEGIKNQIDEGSIVKVEGIIEEFSGSRQIKIKNIKPVGENESVIHEDFLPKSSRDIDTMLKELNDRVNKIENPYLKKLVQTILTGDNFLKFSKVPAGKSWHHSYIHGLLEHTLEIIKICDLMCDFHSRINRDLLICGALLHDFGKVEELTFEKTFDYTTKGRLVGHIVLAAIKVEKHISAIENFPDDLKDQLIHLILSHQGKLEFASPVEPKTLEAIVLYHADELSAKANAYLNAIKEDEINNNEWTRFLPLANTSLFIPNSDSEKI